MDDEFPPATNQDGPAIRSAFPGSRIDVVEDTESRLVLFIPPGGKAASGIGCFAVLWNGILTIITAAFAFAAMQPGGPPWGVFLFLSLFWAVGLGVGYFWIKLKFERLMLLVEPTHAVLRRTLFRRTKTQEIDMAPESSARLYEAYSQNDVPVHGVEISGIRGVLRFGSGLPDADKKWVRSRVNRLIGADDEDQDELEHDHEEAAIGPVEFPERCGKCGASLAGRDAETNPEELKCGFCGHVHRGSRPMGVLRVADAGDLPPEGPFPAQIRIIERSPDRLEYSCWLVESLPARLALGGFLAFFATSWNGGVWTFVIAVAQAPGFFRVFALLFAIPFVLIGLAVGFVAAAVLMGKMRVTLDRDELRVRWGLGPIGWSKKLPTAAIDRVTVATQELDGGQQPRRRRRGESNGEQRTAAAWAGQQKLGLLGTGNLNSARHVAQLVRDQLRDLGMRLPAQ